MPPGVDYGVVIALPEEFERFQSFFALTPASSDGNAVQRFEVADRNGRAQTGLVVFMNSMGPDDARDTTKAFILEYRPALVVSIGIAGALASDVRLGDAVVGTEADDYQHRSKAVPEETAPTTSFRLQWGGRAAPATDGLVQMLGKLREADLHRYEAWQVQCRHGRPDTAAVKSLCRESLIGEDVEVATGPVASGYTVGGATAFKDSLLDKNRNYVALDMESAGVMRGCLEVEPEPKRLILRAISDYADERKRTLDQSTKGAIRAWAMDNACRLLLEVFVTGAARGSARKPAPRPRKTTKRANGSAPREGVRGRVRTLIADRYLSEPYRTIGRGQREFTTAPFHALFQQVATCSTDRLLQDDMFLAIARFVVDSRHAFPLRIDGQPGTGKSTFLSLLYLVLRRASDVDAGRAPFPVYIDLKHYSEAPTHEQGAQQLRTDLGQMEVLLTEASEDLIFMVDGVEDHTRADIEKERMVFDLIGRSARNKKVVGIGLPPHYDAERFGRSDFGQYDASEERVTLRAVPTHEGEKLRKFVQAYLAATGSDPAREDAVRRRISEFRVDEMDLFTVSLLVSKLGTGRYTGATTLSTFYKIYCEDYLSASPRRARNPAVSLGGAGQLAYRYAIKQEEPTEAEVADNPGWRLLHQHPHIRDFLVAYHATELLRLSAGADNQTVFAELDYVFPQRISLFCRDIVRAGSMAAQRTLVAGAVKILEGGHERALPLVGYLVGRVDNFEAKQAALGFLRTCEATIGKWLGSTPADQDQRRKHLLLAARTVYISLITLGDRAASAELIERMLRDPEWDELNRGFHLEYYGDIPYVPRHQMSHKDSLDTFDRTYAGLSERLKEHRLDPDYPALDIELYTLLSLAQHRHAEAKLPDHLRAELLQLMKQFLERSETKSVLLTVYLRMMQTHLRQPSYDVGDAAETLYALKTQRRMGWVDRGMERCESVADHSFGAYLLGLLYLPEREPRWRDYDKREILDMLLIHDLGEAIVGDLLPRQKTDTARDDEKAALEYIGILSTYRQIGDLERVRRLWERFERENSTNAAIARDLDKLENFFQLFLYLKDGRQIPDHATWQRQLAEQIETEAGRAILDIIRRHFTRERTPAPV